MPYLTVMYVCERPNEHLTIVAVHVKFTTKCYWLGCGAEVHQRIFFRLINIQNLMEAEIWSNPDVHEKSYLSTFMKFAVHIKEHCLSGPKNNLLF